MALGGAARILIVEDDPLIAMGLQSLLTDLGYNNIDHAENISGAFELLTTVRPDFAILDVNVGRDLVFPLATKLASGDVPFVFATGLSRETFPVEWRDHPILTKPLTRSELEAALRRVSLSGAAISTAPAAVVQREAPAEAEVDVTALPQGDIGAGVSLPVLSLSDERPEQAEGEMAHGPVAGPDAVSNSPDVSAVPSDVGEPSD